jgi:hypothetical protein
MDRLEEPMTIESTKSPMLNDLQMITYRRDNMLELSYYDKKRFTILNTISRNNNNETSLNYQWYDWSNY